MLRFFLKTALSLSILTSCETTIPSIEGLDYKKWELDKFGCNGDRMKMVRLITQKYLEKIVNIIEKKLG